MKAKMKLHKLLSMLLVLVMVAGLLPAVALAAGPATETADFSYGADTAASLALLNNYKTGTEDSTWDASTKTLTLNGVNFVTTDFTAMQLPAGATIVLNGENTITGGDSGLSCYGIYVSGFVYIEGSGKLTVTAGNSTGGISCGIKATGVVVEGGDVTAKGGTAKIDSYGISNSYSMVIKEGVKVTAIAGTAAGNSIGAMKATMQGGTLIASGDTHALENAPDLEEYPVYWWRTSDSASYTDGSVTAYTYNASQKYAEFRDTDPSTPSETTITIDTVDVKVTAPVAGANPQDAVSNTDNVTVTQTDWYHNGTMHLSASDTFVAGETYEVIVLVEIDSDEYALVDDPTVTFNGSTAGTIEMNDYEFIFYSAEFTATEVPTGYTVSGTATSFNSDTDEVMIQLTESGASEPAYEAVVKGNSASYSIANVLPSTYTMKVMKNNHVTREYTVTVGSSNVVQNVKIHLKGDINGDGKVNIADVGKANAHVKKTSTLTDYEFACADINGDGKINIADVGKINAHVKKTSLLW